jgi:single-stranded DNA-binding protein
MNSVQLIGRLTRDPDADHTTSGTAVTTFRLAIDRPAHNDADFVTIKPGSGWQRSRPSISPVVVVWQSRDASHTRSGSARMGDARSG